MEKITGKYGDANIFNSRLSLFAVLLLVGTAFAGLLTILPAVNGEPIHREDLINDGSFEINPNWTYNTSAGQFILFNWTFGDAYDINNYDRVDINVSLMEKDTEGTPIYIYHWNNTGLSGVPNSEAMNMGDEIPMDIDPSDYVAILNVSISDVSPMIPYIFDVEKAEFHIWDGRDMISDLMVDPSSALNNGEEWINVSWKVNRIVEAVDGAEASLEFNFWNEDMNEWAWDEMKTIEDEEEDDNFTIHDMDSYLLFVYNSTVPLDADSGDYKLYVNGTDDFGYNEVENQTLFTIEWREVPPMVSDGAVSFPEDQSVETDLNDHFMDHNEDPLSFWFNTSKPENVTITWVDETTINITADKHWNGVETVHFHVNDTKDNVSLPLEITVIPVEDDFQPVAEEDRIVLIDEVDKVTHFNPKDFFFDPDGPVEFNVSLGFVGQYNRTWEWTDGNFSVTIDENDTSMGTARILTDLEGGEASLRITAWLNETNFLHSTFTLKVDPVNDLPELDVNNVSGHANMNTTVDLTEIITDVDGPEELNFTEVISGDHIEVEFDNMTDMVTITPEANWTGTTHMSVNVSDSVNHTIIDVPVIISWKMFTLSGQITFEDEQTHLSDVENESKIVTLTLTKGDETYTVETNRTTGEFSIDLHEGTYDMEFELDLDDEYMYEEGVRSGYQLDAPSQVMMEEDTTLELTIEWMEYTPMDEATWDDIDFEGYKIVKDDDEYNITVPVKEGSEGKSGFENLSIELIIANDDDENRSYAMKYNPDENNFYVYLSEEDLEDIDEGKRTFYFTDGVSQTEENTHEFKSSEEAGILTIIILVVLIVLVLVALVFIMRKPADEEFEEEDEEFDSEEERICPGCGEVITEEDVDECPYCGESLEE